MKRGKAAWKQAMNRPRIGERYEACQHAKEGQQHWWSVKGRWIALCPSCHKAFSAGKPVATGATLTREDDRPLMALAVRKAATLNFDVPWGPPVDAVSGSATTEPPHAKKTEE